MTAPWSVLLNVALRTTIVYVALLAGLRLSGTRSLGQMSTFDLVMLLIIANAVQNAMVGPATTRSRRARGRTTAYAQFVGFSEQESGCRPSDLLLTGRPLPVYPSSLCLF